MGTDYKIRVDFSLDDWTWLCHMLNDTLKKLELIDDCGDCLTDVEEVLAVIKAGAAVEA